jgi:hypothetical protein
MDDEELDARVRAHFEAATRQHAVPDFATTFGAAESQARAPQPRRWRIVAAGALAASLAAAVLFELRPTRQPGDDAQLIAELSATTLWTAPSDRWLGTTQSVDYLGLPRFEDMTVQTQEMQTWF